MNVSQFYYGLCPGLRGRYVSVKVQVCSVIVVAKTELYYPLNDIGKEI